MKQGKLKTFNLEQCLFGEHQLIWETNNRPIALVESAKTAIIMTGFYPNYIWMATNGSANLNAAMLQPLINRNIILYPDLGQFEKWNGKAEELRKQDFIITTSNLLEKNATPEDYKSGLDIADYFITNSPLPGEMPERQRGPGQRGLALSQDDILFNTLASKYPNILYLVDKLNLINASTNKPFNLSTRA